jgi:hypothetical protein
MWQTRRQLKGFMTGLPCAQQADHAWTLAATGCLTNQVEHSTCTLPHGVVNNHILLYKAVTRQVY